MATVRVDLEINSKGESALRTTATAMEGVGQAAKRAEQSIDSWGNSQQRAAQRMERMHEEALKMDASLLGTSDRAQQLNATFSALTSTASTTASAFGLQIPALSAVSNAAQVASLGLGNLSRTMVGFNAASAGVVGAGLAIGGALGTLAREIPYVSQTMDDGVMAIAQLAGMLDNLTPKLGAAAQAALNAQVIAERAKAQAGGKANQDAELLRQQTEIENTRRALEAKNKAYDDGIAKAQKAAAAAKVAAAEEKRGAEEAERAQKLLNETLEKTLDQYGSVAAINREQQPFRKKQFDEEAERKAQLKELAVVEEKNAKAREEQLRAERQETEDWIGLIGGVVDAMQAFGLSSDNVFVKLIQGWLAGAQAVEKYAEAENAAQKAQAIFGAAQSAYSGGSVIGGAATGAMLGLEIGGPIGAAIGGVAGGLLGLFGGAKKAREEMEKLRGEFIQSEGGMAALTEKAKAAGVSLDAMFKAKNAKELQAAIAGIKGQLDTFAEANEKLNDAIERYGFTIDELGPRLSQQKLDEQFGQLYQDFQLLTQAGVDNNAILEKMGPNVNDYLQAVIKAGGTIPEAMRPMLQQFLDAGQLTDEFGNKLTDLSGLKFAETLTESVQKIVDAVQSLVDALQQAITNATLLGNIKTIDGGNAGGSPVKPFTTPGFAEGGFVPESGPFGTPVRVAEQGTGGEFMIPANEMGRMRSVTVNAPLTVNVPQGSVSAPELAREITALWQNNVNGARDRLLAATGQKRIA